jgi:predicted DNA-binding transcriptional regulator AlpA
MKYEFKLRFVLPSGSPQRDELVERLGEAGCTDALIGVGQTGRIALDFTRTADSARTAVFSAIADVSKAIPKIMLLEVSPDLVGLTEVAQIAGVSRQYMRKLTPAAAFPAPVHEGSATLWHLAPILAWFRKRGSYDIAQATIDVARVAMQVNLARQVRGLTPLFPRELRTVLAG